MSKRIKPIGRAQLLVDISWNMEGDIVDVFEVDDDSSIYFYDSEHRWVYLKEGEYKWIDGE